MHSHTIHQAELTHTITESEEDHDESGDKAIQ